MSMTALPILKHVWVRAKASAEGAVKDESGQAALVIITIVIVAAGIAISQMSVMNNRRALDVARAQRVNFDKITNAIDVYAISDQAGTGTYLIPCPATTGTNGAAQPYVGGNCTGVNRGIVPWVTLGLAEEDVIDVNGNYLTYVVDTTDIAACDGTTPTAVSLLNQGSAATDANYAIISHGSNGWGAFNSNSNNQINGAGVGTNERDNCPAGGACAVPTADAYRSGPSDDTIGATFFDDIVRGVSFAETFTDECMVLSDPPDDESAFRLTVSGANGEQQIQENTTRTTSATTNLVGVLTQLDSNGTVADQSDDTRTISFSEIKGGEDTAACIFFDQPFPVIDHKVRILADLTARHDTFDSRGGGTVITFMSYDPDVDPTVVGAGDGFDEDSGYVMTSTVCGGTNSYMGFSDDEAIAARQLPGVPRFGIEIDTRSDNGTLGEGTNTNQDSTVEFGTANAAWNHIVIVGANNDHMGTDQSDTGDLRDDDPTPGDSATVRGDGPSCISGVTGSGASGDTGCATEPNVGITSPIVGTVGFIEVGDPGPTDGDFHQMRIELTYEGGVCGQDEVAVQFWFYPSDGVSDGNCDADVATCSDLTVDMDTSEVDPTTVTKSACVPWTGHFNDEFMRIGFTTGQQAGAASLLDQFTIRAIDIFSNGKAAPTPGQTAPAGTQSREIHNVNVSDDIVRVVQPTGTGTFDSEMGLVDMDPSTQTVFADDRIDTGVRLVARNGTLDVQLNGGGLPDPLTDSNGIGIQGFGSTATNEIDMFWVRTVSAAPDEGIYVNADAPELREALEIRFYSDNDDETGSGASVTTSYERVSINLGRFSSNSTTAQGDRSEEVIVRAFSGGTFLGDQVIQTCNPSGSAGTANMFLSLDYSANPVDKIILIPDILTDGGSPATYPFGEYGSDFYIRGIKGCSAERSCGLTATSDCETYQGSFPYGGLGNPATAFDVGDMSGLITLNNLQSHFVGTSGVALIGTSLDSETSWQNLEGEFTALTVGDVSDIGPVYVDIIPTGALLRFNEDNDPGDDYNEGIWISGGQIQSALGESVEFRWANDWNTALISLGGFGEVGTSGSPTNRYERVTVEGLSNGVTVANTTVESCADSTTHGEGGASADDTATANLIFNWGAGITIDTIRITPEPTFLAQPTEFAINGIRMCTEAAGCTVTDFGSIQANGSCTATFSVP